jgi:anti-sigma factor RsiW
MKKENIAPDCERGDDLISFLYGEADEPEAEFEEHLQHCSGCKAELASFGQLRASIGSWRREALAGFASGRTPIETMRKRSAVAALREFFHLAPLWMKGALAFVNLLFCLFAVLTMDRLRTEQQPVATADGKKDAVYTLQDVDRIVKQALEQQRSVSPASHQPAPEQDSDVAAGPKPRKNPINRIVGRSTQLALAGSRRPLSKSEREQLAADLRLITPGDEEGLDLLGDRINQ